MLFNSLLNYLQKLRFLLDMSDSSKLKRSKIIESLESDSFSQNSFISSRHKKSVSQDKPSEEFDFGTTAELGIKESGSSSQEDSLFSPYV